MNNEASDNDRQSFDEGSSKDELRRVQIVHVGSARFGIFAEDIATIVPWRQPAPLPQAPASVLGVVSVQGRMLTVIDLATLTSDETPSADAPADKFHGIVALRGDEQLALAVGAVGDIVRIAPSEIKPQPENEGAPVLGSLQLEGSDLNILYLRDLFTAAIQGRERRRRRF
jgi:purine-binding chemotaxis protein CheW